MKNDHTAWWLIAALGLAGPVYGQSALGPSAGDPRIVSAKEHPGAAAGGQEEDEDEDEDEDEEEEDDTDAEELNELEPDPNAVGQSALIDTRAVTASDPVGTPARQSHPLGFSVGLPPGWRVYATRLESVTLSSGDGRSQALIRGVAGHAEPSRWLTDEVLKGEPIAARWRTVAVDRPSSQITRAAFELEGSDGVRRFATGFVMAGTGGATAMIAAAPAEHYARELPVISEVLYSFRIEGRPRAESPGTPGTVSSLEFVSWRDPNEGAFTVDTPKGWNIEGGVFRPDLFGTRSGLTMTAPQGRHVVWLHDPNLPRIFVHVSASLRGLGQVQPNYMDYQDAPTFAAAYLNHRFGQARVERVTPLPAIVQRLDTLGRAIGKMNEVNTAASVDFRLADGRLGVINVAISLLPTGFDDGGSWSVAEMCGFVSAPEETAMGSAVLQRALASFAVDPRWFAGELQANRAAAEALTRHRNEVNAIYRQITEDRYASQARTAEQRGQLLAGTTQVLDAETGERFEVQAGSRYYFRHIAAEPMAGRPVGVGTDLDHNPSPGDFRRLLEIQVDGTSRHVGPVLPGGR